MCNCWLRAEVEATQMINRCSSFNVNPRNILNTIQNVSLLFISQSGSVIEF